MEINKDLKKKIERTHLNSFISNEKLNLRISQIKESETPDFQLKIDGKLISVEHTILLNPNTIKVEVYKSEIVEIAKKKFEEKYNEKLYVLVTFSGDILKGGKYKFVYANEIFELVESIYLRNKDFEFDIHSKDFCRILPDYIESISINNILNFDNWQSFGAYVVDFIDLNWLKQRIEIKEKLIKNYVGKFDEKWLLFVTDFGFKSSAYKSEYMDFSQIETEFDKVFIFSFRSKKIEFIK